MQHELEKQDLKKKKEYTHTGYFNEKSKQNIRRI